jgi:hypothetical protein
MEWAERDLKDLILRDYNHPSVIMWSIGNEIEWTFPHYPAAFAEVNASDFLDRGTPEFDPKIIRPILNKLTNGEDSLVIIAHQLSEWVKETDTTRPVTCGSVISSIGLASGYADATDVFGMNYQPDGYDAAHVTYPDVKIVGSENHGSWNEWKAASQREFVSGIFVWTGFAYLGEAGPWPRKGLNISFFDFAGFKNPRAHFYECLWKPDPKVYMVTTPVDESEYSYSEPEGWIFTMQYTEPPAWDRLRLWEWYEANEHWNYTDGEEIVVQVYTNCDEAELFLDEESLGRKSRADFQDDNIIKWLVPFRPGTLKVKGFTENQTLGEYSLTTTGQIAGIELTVDREIIRADRYDVAHVYAKLVDEAGREVRNEETEIRFSVDGSGSLLALDNGWERNVEYHFKESVRTHNGKALAIIQSSERPGEILVTASAGVALSRTITLEAAN